jgi:hypothetical protein
MIFFGSSAGLGALAKLNNDAINKKVINFALQLGSICAPRPMFDN